LECLAGDFRLAHGEALPPVLPRLPRLGASEQAIRERVIALPAGAAARV